MASTKARTVANRKNALLSTGPKTAAGKARSSANSLKHGLSGEGLCLPIEDAAVVQSNFDRFSEELCPVSAEELYYVRRLAIQTLRVDRCYLKEAANVQMAVRDAIPNYDRKLYDEMRATADQFPDDPFGTVFRLKQSPHGVDFMVDLWRGLRASLAESGNLGSVEQQRADMLSGRRDNSSGKSPFEDLCWKLSTGLERVDGECRTGPEQVDACKARAKLELEALIGRYIEDLLVHRSTLPLADAERSRQEAPLRAAIDLSNAGQLLRRYENAAAREVTKIFAYFDEKRAMEAAENLDASPVPVEESAALASFGHHPENASIDPAVETGSAAEDTPIAPERPVETSTTSVDTPIRAVESPRRE